MIACMTLGLFVCLLLMAMAENLRAEGVPHIYRGHEIIRIDMQTGGTTYSGSGECTHTGTFQNAGTGQSNLQTGDFTLTGALTAADGSRIEWTGGGNLLVPGDYYIALTGGSGRFENATGELPTWGAANMTQVIDAGFLIITFDSSATGWISF